MHELFAVFGNPVLHSKSPQIFNPAFEDLNINAKYIRIRPQSAKDICTLMKDIPIAGASITSPFKEEIMNFLDDISVDAHRIGAVNTVVNIDGRLNGYNTDHAGVTESLHEAGVSIANSKCLVLGGGGAARAAVYGLTNQGAKVFICNRTFEKAQKITDDFGCELTDWDNFNTSITFDIVISALLPEAVPPFLQSLHFNYLLDASYKMSKVSEITKKMGPKIIPGERWLIYQAAEAFELFCQKKPSIKAMERDLKKIPERDSINIVNYSLEAPGRLKEEEIDLLISSEGNDPRLQKNIIDEEIDKAYSS